MLKKVVGSNMGRGQRTRSNKQASGMESEVMVRINGCGVGMRYIEEELVN